MKRSVILLLLLTACHSSNPPPKPTGWQLQYSPTTSQTADGFTFPSDNQGADIYVEPATLHLGATITATFTITGSGALHATEGSAPASAHLYFQRSGDNFSAQGDYVSYRWWSSNRADIPGPGSYTITESVEPTRWTNVYGQQDVAGFNAAVGSTAFVGITFGGEFFAHGVSADGNLQFHLTSFSIQ